jgi:hypothetical protein
MVRNQAGGALDSPVRGRSSSEPTLAAGQAGGCSTNIGSARSWETAHKLASKTTPRTVFEARTADRSHIGRAR